MQVLQLLNDNRRRVAQPINRAREGDSASLYIYGPIYAEEGAVSATDVVAALVELKGVKNLAVRINSPGGNMWEGRAIMAALRDFPANKIAYIDSLAASAATSIALACDEVVMSEGAFWMIHNAQGVAFGDKNAMRKTADDLEKIEGAIVTDYTDKTGKTEAQVRAWMDDETWFTADEALAAGFVNRVQKPEKAVRNIWKLDAFRKTPEPLRTPGEPELDSQPEPLPVAQPINSMTQANRNRLRLAQLA